MMRVIQDSNDLTEVTLFDLLAARRGLCYAHAPTSDFHHEIFNAPLVNLWDGHNCEDKHHSTHCGYDYGYISDALSIPKTYSA